MAGAARRGAARGGGWFAPRPLTHSVKFASRISPHVYNSSFMNNGPVELRADKGSWVGHRPLRYGG